MHEADEVAGELFDLSLHRSDIDKNKRKEAFKSNTERGICERKETNGHRCTAVASATVNMH